MTKDQMNEEVDKRAAELATDLRFRAIPLQNSKDRVAKFIVALGATANVTKSLWYAEIPHRTGYYWRTKYPAFKKLWDQAIESKVDRAQERIFDLVESPDESIALKASEKVLKSFRPESWGNKVKIDREVRHVFEW